ncbi:MAG TPA: zf-HC2 domain-containing protein [Gemmatimonadales bacterium]|nr:zf-HC2 domain-containing protein [Gemmatimonadales bacterium]
MTHPGDLLSAYADGQLDAAERHSVVEHLSVCAACRAELDQVEAAREAVRSLPLLEPPPGVIPGRERRRLLRPVWAWATAGAVAVALAVSLTVAPGRADPQVDLDTLANRHTARVLVQPGIQTVRAPAEGG